MLSSTFRSLALGDGPDALVAVGGHHVEDFHLALHDLAVGLAVGELQIGAAAVDRVAVHRAVAVEPVEVLVEDGLAELFLGVPGPSLTPARSPKSAWSMTPASQPVAVAAFRWTPLIVSGLARFAYRLELGVNRSTKGTPLALATSAIAAV